jgi:hypothetical protein
MRFIVLLVVAAVLTALDALAVRAGLPQPLGVILLLVIGGVSVFAIMRTPAWGRSIERDRERAGL